MPRACPLLHQYPALRWNFVVTRSQAGGFTTGRFRLCVVRTEPHYMREGIPSAPAETEAEGRVRLRQPTIRRRALGIQKP